MMYVAEAANGTSLGGAGHVPTPVRARMRWAQRSDGRGLGCLVIVLLAVALLALLLLATPKEEKAERVQTALCIGSGFHACTGQGGGQCGTKDFGSDKVYVGFMEEWRSCAK